MTFDCIDLIYWSEYEEAVIEHSKTGGISAFKYPKRSPIAYKMIKATLILAVISFVSIDGLNIQPRIINGILSNPTDFPFFVYVSNCFSHCSATLISERYLLFKLTLFSSRSRFVWRFSWVLTAAHCLVRNETLKVHLGINKNGAFIESATIPTTSQHIHPQYRQNILDLPDIGL